MAAISEEEKLRRSRIVQSVLGTQAMEGLQPDQPTLAILQSYATGDRTVEEFSAAMDSYAAKLLAADQQLAGVA